MREGRLGPGCVLDRYEIVRLIAAGGMGEVYEATHTFTGRVVALKCLKLQHAHREDLARRMRMEAVALCKLNHPNLVTVYDAGITDGLFWIAMDRLVGRTLREELASRGPLPEVEARKVAAEIADGVAAAHALSVVHRDLKPENIFLTERGEVKVLDLGTAKFYGWGAPATESLRVLGTPHYMSPEQVRGEPLGPASDVYALGVMLYEMLSARHPYAADGGMPSSLDVGPLHLFAEPLPLPQVAPGVELDLWELVRRALAKSPEARPRSMAELAASLRAARPAKPAALPPKTVVMARGPAAAPPWPPPAASADPSPEPAPTRPALPAEARKLPLVAVGAGLAVGLVMAAFASLFVLSRRPLPEAQAPVPTPAPPPSSEASTTTLSPAPPSSSPGAPEEPGSASFPEATAAEDAQNAQNAQNAQDAPAPTASSSAPPPARAATRPPSPSPPRPRPPSAETPLPKSGL